MNWTTKGCFLFLLCFLSCKNEKDKKTTAFFSDTGLVEVEQLLENNASIDVKLIDFRKREDYLLGHIPNAMQLWRPDIEDTSLPYKGIMASKESIEALFSNLGIRSDDTVVVYDDKGSCDAARLWWVLKCYGFDRVKILNGGFHAWKAANVPLSKALPDFKRAVFKLPDTKVRKHHIDRQKLYGLLLDSLPYFVLDTRTADEFSGKRHKSGAAKAGRISNSKLLDWAQSVDFTSTRKFKSIAELKQLYASLQMPKDAEIITYCHSGVRSAHSTFVLTELLGYKNVRNYDGSWAEWSHFDNLPFEKDSITVILQ